MMDDPERSLCWDEAENRKHSIRAILATSVPPERAESGRRPTTAPPSTSAWRSSASRGQPHQHVIRKGTPPRSLFPIKGYPMSGKKKFSFGIRYSVGDLRGVRCEAAAPAAAIGNQQFFWWIFLIITFLCPLRHGSGRARHRLRLRVAVSTTGCATRSATSGAPASAGTIGSTSRCGSPVWPRCSRPS